MIRQTQRLCIPATHPTTALHFPGLPIVPGALLLDEAAALIAGSAPLRFRAVKFIAPVRYGEALELSWQTDDHLTSFTLHRPGETAPLLTGTLETLA
jgi:3-hydroxymyristoyl/3-hydroxydecanoyl-(acyl carrier protein) dehydratase